jgi:hypothetical protein
MPQSFDAKRRAISAAAALALLGFPVITISGCGGGGSPAGPSSPPAAGDVEAAISANHGHTATITAAELQAGSALTLHMRGSATHDHTVTLSGVEVVAVRERQRVSKPSSTDDGHNHTVTFN